MMKAGMSSFRACMLAITSHTKTPNPETVGGDRALAAVDDT